MSHCSVIIDSRGALLSVLIGVSAARKSALQSAGVLVPNPVIANLLVDTGASCTCLDIAVIIALGLQPTGTVKIHTPSTDGTPHSCSTYDVEFIIPGKGASKIIPALPILEGHFSAQGHQGLIGRDILSEAHITYSGVNNFMMLSFI